MTKMKKEGIKLFIVALASFLMLVFCIVAAAPDSTLRFIDPTPADNTQEQDFTCGVLALNTHKSIYLPDETAFIGIAVLDNEGHMICDADVTLTITDPSNIETVLSTGNGLINVSPQCCVYGVTNLPDYYTNYTVGGVGTYVMRLTAVTADGTKSITDDFTVQNSVDFDVARDGATRIYPSVPYVMNFTIKANKNYTGLIREYVPASFVITQQDGLTVTTVGDTDTKILTWNKNLVEGETYNIYYEFDAPDVSPYLFTLGALEIGNFKEIRQWQIASDATATYYFNANDNNEKWTHDERMVDGNTGTYASASADGKTQWLTGSTCLGTELGTISKVEIRAYGYLEAAGASVSLRPVFNAGDGTDHTAITATTAGWGSYIDITTDNNASSPWTWSDVLNLDCDVEFNEEHGGNKGHVAKVEIRVTYPTWVSYRESGHSTEWGTVADPYDSTYHIVYMYGEGFKTSHDYHVGYYDKDGYKVLSNGGAIADESGNLSSQYDFTSNTSAVADTWHAVVFDDSQGSPPTTYAACSGAAGYVVEDDFHVLSSAIPEFPTVVAAIAVCMLCAVAYMVMRRKEGKG
jgi:hypothetical protein